MKLSRIRMFPWLLGATLVAFGCSSSSSHDELAPGGTTLPGAPPAPVNEHPACLLSADCPAGTHCDLQECVQDCNTKSACTDNRTCSPRARCLQQNAPDADPKPSTQYIGSIEASPTNVRLTERDAGLDVKLTAHSSERVRYRVEVDAPHLSLPSARGEFTGATSLHFAVDTFKLKGRNIPGTIRIFTSLGKLVVAAPMHAGVTGSYSGVLRYQMGALGLGDARIALDVLENAGVVSVRVDSSASLLFPATATGETTGTGLYSLRDGLDFVVSQAIDPSLGGDRNHFRRPIGRTLRFRLKPNTRGDLEGTFEESVENLFATKTQLGGSVVLEFRPSKSDPVFTVASSSSTLPTAPSTAPLGPAAVFGWSDDSCKNIICGCTGSSWCILACDPQASLQTLEATYATPLYRTFTSTRANGSVSSMPMDDIAMRCQNALSVRSLTDWNNDTLAQSCGLPAGVACGLQLRSQQTTSDADNGRAAVRMVGELVAPALLVAKNELVSALKDSFVKGPTVEQEHLSKASTALGPVTTWMLQPALLEYLRGLTPQTARGPSSDVSGIAGGFPAARALADLYDTASVVDSETARLSAVFGNTKAGFRTEAQSRALLTYLEALTVGELARAWGGAPSTAASHFIGLLTPLDSGFGAALQGPSVLGIPESFVPFVYRPTDVASGATNFEQMLAIAAAAVENEKSVEATFLAHYREFEAGQSQLAHALDTVRGQYDTQIRAICGKDFDPNAVTAEADWERCGQGQSGNVGDVSASIDTAKGRIDVIRSRMDGARQKIGIELRTIAAVRKIQAEEIQFISDTGSQLAALAYEETLYSAAIQASMAAANIVNVGTGFAAGVGIMVVGYQQADLAQRKEDLRTALSMHAAQTEEDKEYTRSMAAVQKDFVDLAQMGVEISQEGLSITELDVHRRNLVQQAMGLFEERRRVLATASNDPSNDPSYRLLRDRASLDVMDARAQAQRQLYLAVNALQYELNMSIAGIDGAVLRAHDSTSLAGLQYCLKSVLNSSRMAFGQPQSYTAEAVSLRKLLGITGPRTDEVTGEVLSEGDQFRRILLQNQNLDGRGGVGVGFTTNLQPGNGLWSTDLCADRIESVQAQLVGDFLGDNSAQVHLSQGGGSVMRACDSDKLVSWSMGSGSGGALETPAVIQAGVNTWGDAPPNGFLFGQSVARASWKLVIPGPTDAPANADVDLSHLEDVVLRIKHTALPRGSARLPVDFSCLNSGAGK